MAGRTLRAARALRLTPPAPSTTAKAVQPPATATGAATAGMVPTAATGAAETATVTVTATVTGSEQGAATGLLSSTLAKVTGTWGAGMAPTATVGAAHPRGPTMRSRAPAFSTSTTAAATAAFSTSTTAAATAAAEALGEGLALSDAMSLRTLGVVGAGQMGSGIAQLGAVAGMDVTMVDVGQAAIERGLKRIHSSLDRLVKRDSLSQEESEAAFSRIRSSSSMGELASADFVVEAVAENEELKRRVFAELDSVTPRHAVLASNTSSISVTLIGGATSRPEKVIGMHFMNPPPIMSLVEIVNGLATDANTTDLTEGLALRMGKTVCFARDHPGFIVNRLLMPMINEAFYALLEGVGTAEDIDTGMRLGTNQPMGPLTLADFIGLDTCVAIMRVLHLRLGDAKYRPCPLLVQYVDAGWLGRKSGRGVYVYPSE